MSRIYNFYAGPATIPEEVLLQARDELLDWQHTGMSVMEISHRSEKYTQLTQEIEQDLRDLMKIPASYKVLFLQGGARTQFAMIPLNLLQKKTGADYVNTGIWSKIAIDEAKRYCHVNTVASSEEQGYTTIPPQAEWHSDPQAAYLHYVDNETVNGVEFSYVPKSEVPLVSDMSSNILSRPIDVSQFGLIYAGSQKNLGPAGLTVVVIREDLIAEVPTFTPTMLTYKTHVDNKSLYNTPPTFTWYCIGLELKWLKRQGGVEKIAEINQRKSDKLYQCIDSSDFYYNSVDPLYRSRMNVVFRLKDESLNETFLQESLAAGLAGLKGHSYIGGMRASLFNAMPEAGVDALIKFMQDFAKHYG
jgi:phosphoserine aminotransferase